MGIEITRTDLSSEVPCFIFFLLFFSFLVADTRLYTLPCRSVGPSVRRSVTFLNCERFWLYCSCPTVRDWIAVYPALFLCDSQSFAFFFQCVHKLMFLSLY